MRILPPRPGPAAPCALLLLLAAACSEPGEPRRSAPPAASAVDSVQATAPRRSYERSVVFISTTGDSVFIVPWIVEARSRAGGVTRLARGWLGRSGEWQPFLREEWESPPSREPWRIVPHGPFRILVGPGDRLDRILYDDGNRRVEVSLDDVVAEWAGNRGGSFNVLEGGMVLGNRRLPGQLLDVSQGIRLEEGTMGDWMYLTSGDSLSMAIQSPLHDPDDPAYQGWARFEGREYQWPAVEVEWLESSSYEPARRDIPGLLGVRSPDGDMEGEIRVTTLLLETRPGDGPVLPVDGLMAVEGTLVLSDREVPVRGVLRHRQP